MDQERLYTSWPALTLRLLAPLGGLLFVFGFYYHDWRSGIIWVIVLAAYLAFGVPKELVMDADGFRRVQLLPIVRLRKVRWADVNGSFSPDLYYGYPVVAYGLRQKKRRRRLPPNLARGSHASPALGQEALSDLMNRRLADYRRRAGTPSPRPCAPHDPSPGRGALR